MGLQTQMFSNYSWKGGAEIDIHDVRGMTALMWATRESKNPDVVWVLLEVGADGKITCNNGKTAFDYAKEHEHQQGTKANWLLNEE